MLKWLWLSALVLAADQVTKVLAAGMLELYVSIPVTPMFNLTLMHNPGAAFSFLGDAGGWQRWFFSAIAIVVSFVLLFWIKKLTPEERWLAIALALVLGGAVGNLTDRLLYGYVIDFIDVYYQNWHWPAFNIADSAISVGVAILLIDALRPTAKSNPE